MTQPYPLPRQLRQTDILTGDGVNAAYGPFAFKIFDIADVVVYKMIPPETQFSVASVFVTKVANLPLDNFIVQFGAAMPVNGKFVVCGQRLHERSAGVTRGPQLSQEGLEKELSKQGVILQELRRDVDRAIKNAFGAPTLTIADLMEAVAQISTLDTAAFKPVGYFATASQGVAGEMALSAIENLVMPMEDEFEFPALVGAQDFPIPGGYDIGTVKGFLLNGVPLIRGVDWTEPGGGVVRLVEPIVAADIPYGLDNADVRIVVGRSIAGLTGLDQRWFRKSDYFGYPALLHNGSLLILQETPSLSQYANVRIERNILSNSGDGDGVNHNLIVSTSIDGASNNIQAFQFNLLARIDINKPTLGDMVASYAQAWKRAEALAWAQCLEMRCNIPNTTRPSIALEAGIFVNGTDANQNRFGIDVSIGSYDGTEGDNQVTAGIRVGPTNGNGGLAQYLWGIKTQGKGRVGFDTSDMDLTYGNVSLNAKIGQRVQWSNNSGNYFDPEAFISWHDNRFEFHGMQRRSDTAFGLGALYDHLVINANGTILLVPAYLATS